MGVNAELDEVICKSKISSVAVVVLSDVFNSSNVSLDSTGVSKVQTSVMSYSSSVSA